MTTFTQRMARYHQPPERHRLVEIPGGFKILTDANTPEEAEVMGPGHRPLTLAEAEERMDWIDHLEKERAKACHSPGK